MRYALIVYRDASYPGIEYYPGDSDCPTAAAAGPREFTLITLWPSLLAGVGSIGLAGAVLYFVASAHRPVRSVLASGVVFAIALSTVVVGSGRGLATYREHFTDIRSAPHCEVHALFEGDVFVYRSLYEGSVIAIYEVLAFGLPVLTSFVVPIRDANALKEKLLLLHRDQELRDEMGRSARRRAEEFTWQAYRRRLGGLCTGFSAVTGRPAARIPRLDDRRLRRFGAGRR